MKTCFAVALVACSSKPAEHAPAPPVTAPRSMALAISTAPSIYELPMQLHDADAKSIGLDIDRGKPVLVSMFYSSCTTACPLLISELAHTLAEAARRDARVLLVSFDPARDTPERLREVARERHLDDRWTLAVASEADARALAAVLGVKYRRLENGDFAHGATMVVLDREGRPIARTDTLADRTGVVAALAAQ